MEEIEVFDIEFLHGCANPTIILIHQDVNGRHIKTHEISLKDKEFTKNPWKQDNIENEASLIIPVPEPICGAIIVGQESILYHNGSSYLAVAPPIIKVLYYTQYMVVEFLDVKFHFFVILQESNVCCYARIDAKGTSYLLGDMCGHLLMLLLITEENPDGTIKVKKPKVEFLGIFSIPSMLYRNRQFSIRSFP